MSLIFWGSLAAASDQTMETVAKTPSSKFRAALVAIIESIVTTLLASSPTVVAAAAAAVSSQLALKKCVHFEAGEVIYDGPGGAAATHYVLPDHNGELVVRATPFPVPSATSPAFDW